MRGTVLVNAIARCEQSKGSRGLPARLRCARLLLPVASNVGAYELQALRGVRVPSRKRRQQALVWARARRQSHGLAQVCLRLCNSSQKDAIFCGAFVIRRSPSFAACRLFDSAQFSVPGAHNCDVLLLLLSITVLFSPIVCHLGCRLE